MDSNSSTEVGFGEFLSFIATVKEMQLKASVDPKYKEELMFQALLTPDGQYDETRDVKGQHGHVSVWDAAMARVDKETLNLAWETIYKSIRASPGKDMSEKVLALFRGLDSDESGDLEHRELGEGLKATGILLNDRQLLSLIHSVDKDGDGRIDLEEFISQIQSYIQKQEQLKQDQEQVEIKSALHRRQSLLGLGDGSTANAEKEVESMGVLTTHSELNALDRAKRAIRDKMAELDAKDDVVKSHNEFMTQSNNEKGESKTKDESFNSTASTEPISESSSSSFEHQRMVSLDRVIYPHMDEDRHSIDSQRHENVQLPRAAIDERSRYSQSQPRPQTTLTSKQNSGSAKRRAGTTSPTGQRAVRKPSQSHHTAVSPRGQSIAMSETARDSDYSAYSKEELISRILELEDAVCELKTATIDRTNTLLMKALNPGSRRKVLKRGARSIVVADDVVDGSDGDDREGLIGNGTSPLLQALTRIERAAMRSTGTPTSTPTQQSKRTGKEPQQSEGVSVFPRARALGRSGPMEMEATATSRSKPRGDDPDVGSFI